MTINKTYMKIIIHKLVEDIKAKELDYGINGVKVQISFNLTEAQILLEALSKAKSVPVIPLDKLKQAREEIEKLYEELDGYDPQALGDYASHVDEILDKLIESEDK